MAFSAAVPPELELIRILRTLEGEVGLLPFASNLEDQSLHPCAVRTRI